MKALIQNNEVIIKSNEVGVLIGKIYQLKQVHVWPDEVDGFELDDLSIVEVEEDPIVTPEPLPLTAEQIRKEAEASATVEFLGQVVKADDKAVTMLQAYISSMIESVMWKCVDGWLELDKEGMSLLLGEILDKKASLFEDEYANQA